jgi:Dihydrodipicolinate synthetase family
VHQSGGGEIFCLTREEKRRVLEIAMEEAPGNLPIIAGTWALTTREMVEIAKDVNLPGPTGGGFGILTKNGAKPANWLRGAHVPG